MDQADEEPEGEVEGTYFELEGTQFYKLLLPVRSLPGDAHVHDVSAQQERHEGHRPADGAGSSGQEGEERFHHWDEDQNPAWTT